MSICVCLCVCVYVSVCVHLCLFVLVCVCMRTKWCFLPTGWRRHIGCLKLQVFFRKRATNHRALLQKMTYKNKASCASLPPCNCCLAMPRNEIIRLCVCLCVKLYFLPTPPLPYVCVFACVCVCVRVLWGVWVRVCMWVCVCAEVFGARC